MRVLGIETSVATGTVALVADGQCLDEMVVSEDLSHSINLTARVDALCGKNDCRLEGIDLIAVGLGPGSFTGIRVGVAFAKGISAATGIPVAGFCGFDAVMSALIREKELSAFRQVAVLFDARRGEFYCRIYAAKNGWHPAGADGIVEPKELERYASDTTLFAGPDLAALLRGRAFDCAGQGVEVIDMPPRAREIARMASGLPVKEREQYRDLNPLYIRRTQAEEKLT